MALQKSPGRLLSATPPATSLASHLAGVFSSLCLLARFVRVTLGRDFEALRDSMDMSMGIFGRSGKHAGRQKFGRSVAWSFSLEASSVRVSGFDPNRFLVNFLQIKTYLALLELWPL